VGASGVLSQAEVHYLVSQSPVLLAVAGLNSEQR
jgi:hypothetical protein